MVKKELLKAEFDFDSFDELTEEEVKSPKKAKKEAKAEGTPSPNSKTKRPRGAGARSGWTREEEEAFMEFVHNLVTANASQAVKEHPILAARKSDGCAKHWIAWRRKLETSILGAPTIDGNGKKIVKPDAAKDDSA
ncbi:hypothetical protein PSEUBRA_003820 [Kalmanozyma brasiliensis GHG001]|uniref:uncharacterized protein n=1 Tax=Kalmanozyma brasiliensis (strain GHG001) TaxID=1365824 RepID=UPI001CE91979|nr:uncharacterized protein PSEUBRA_003820 [Kalmanozyma brasiliensis GHG001]KAF6767297.1 hypothetical protein PSEUBRA_003820 [Kalmanozyma brasiliensis GHG001]